MDGNVMYKTKWTHNAPALSEQAQTHLYREIELISDELDSASDLIFHTVFLTEDMDSAIVIVDGREAQ